MERENPELFRPAPRRYSRSSSSNSVNSDLPKRPSPLHPFSEMPKNGANEFTKKTSGEEGQLRYWTNEMCSKSPHLFDYVVTVSLVSLHRRCATTDMLSTARRRRDSAVRFVVIPTRRSAHHSLRSRLSRIPHQLRLCQVLRHTQQRDRQWYPSESADAIHLHRIPRD